MLTENISLFIKSANLGLPLKGLLFKWDECQNRLKLLPFRSRDLYLLILKIIILNLATFTIIIQTVTYKGDRLHSLQTGYVIVGLLTFCVHLPVCLWRRDSIIAFVNGLLQFASRYGKTKSTTLRSRSTIIVKLNLLFAHVMYWTGLIMPIAITYGIHFKNPCKPSLPGYWWLEECGNHDWNNLGQQRSHFDKVLKVILFLFNHWLWSFGIHVSVFVIGGVQILCTSSLKDFLEM